MRVFSSASKLGNNPLQRPNQSPTTRVDDPFSIFKSNNLKQLSSFINNNQPTNQPKQPTNQPKQPT